MKRLFVICFLFLLGKSILAQENHFTFECFDFSVNEQLKSLDGWLNEASFFTARASLDTTIVRNGKHPLLVSNTFVLSHKILRYNMQLAIPMPATQADKMLVELSAKSQNISRVYLVLSGINTTENILYSDTLFLNGNNDWHTYVKEIQLKDVVSLHCKMVVFGGDGADNQKLWLDKMDIRIGTKSIKDSPVPVCFADTSEVFRQIQPLSFSPPYGYEQIPILKNKKVIALGETIHGSATLNRVAMQLIKYRIETANCKLVLLELPVEHMLFVNRFVQGDERFQLNALKEYLITYSDEFIELCKWIKDYNKKTTDKVYLLGYDVPLFRMESPKWVARYLSILNQERNHLGLKQMCTQLQNSVDTFEPALQTFQMNNGFKNLLGEKESEILKWWMKNLPRNLSFQLCFQDRDSNMWKNVEYLMELLSVPESTVTIYTHLGHANYVSGFPCFRLNPSMGEYAKKSLKDDYVCVGLCVGGGTFYTADSLPPYFFPVKTLVEPPENSLEKILRTRHQESFYMPVSSILTPMYLRYIGNSYVGNQFQFVTPGCRMDAVIYIDKSEALKLIGN